MKVKISSSVIPDYLLVVLTANLDPGAYLILLTTFEPEKEADVELTLYSSRTLLFRAVK